MATFSMTPLGTGTRLRVDHNTFAAVITSYGTSARVQGDVLWEAPADGNEVKRGDKWLRVTHVNDQPVTNGWMAYIHKGIPICGNFQDGGVSAPPPEPVNLDEFESFTLIPHYADGSEGLPIRLVRE